MSLGTVASIFNFFIARGYLQTHPMKFLYIKHIKLNYFSGAVYSPSTHPCIEHSENAPLLPPVDVHKPIFASILMLEKS